jgi:L-2-hydroxycarboxylate dehydrogenase (NAD+)
VVGRRDRAATSASATAPAGTTAAVRVRHGDLCRTVQEVLAAEGLPAEHAARSADVLVAADLRGVGSHGVSNMLRRYVEWLASGHLNPRPRPQLLHEAPCTAAYDGDGGLGIALLPDLMGTAIAKAKRYGVGMISVRNARHSGMLAYHSMLALADDLIGVCATSGGPRVVPTFGREARLGTNPLSVAVPTASGTPFVFDAATSTVAYNKITAARREGRLLGPRWCADVDGTPMTEPVSPERPVDQLMLPLGSTPEGGSHKGYALGVIVEVLAGILAGGGYIGRYGLSFSGHFLAAVDPAAFGDPDAFKAEMGAFTDYLRSTPPAAGYDRVLVPNDLETETERVRRRDGVPLHPEVVEWFDATCRRLDLPLLPR